MQVTTLSEVLATGVEAQFLSRLEARVKADRFLVAFTLRKGGPGTTRSDLLVINKIDLAALVGANLGVMEADALRMRGKRPFVFTNLKSGEGVDQIASFVIEKGGLGKSAT